MAAARLCGLTPSQAHTLVNLCNNKQVSGKTLAKSKSEDHSRVNNPKRIDSSKNSEYKKMIEDKQKLKRLGHQDLKHYKGDHYQSRDAGDHSKHSIFSSSSDENDDDSSSESTTSSNSPTESPSPKRTRSAKSSSSPSKRSAKEKLDATLKRIKYLEEKQQLQVILHL